MLKTVTRFKVLTGGNSRELEEELNTWVLAMETETDGRFRLVSALPHPMGGEILYVLARYELDVKR